MNRSKHAALEIQIVSSIPALKAFARRFSRNEYDVDDLVQAAALKALCNAGRFHPRSDNAVRSWLFTILRNTFINEYNFNKRFLRIDFTNNCPDLSVQPTQEWRVHASDVALAVDQLSASHREVLMLHMSGVEYAEVARRCNCEVGTVKSRLNRAWASLAATLLEERVTEAAQLV